MTENQNIRLEQIKNRATRYELVLRKAGHELRLAYTRRKNRAGMLDMIWRNSAELVSFTGAQEFKLGADKRSAIMGEWLVAFSGRTERDAILAGELPWFWAGKRIEAEVEITPKA
jgi:hypothetical protein